MTGPDDELDSPEEDGSISNDLQCSGLHLP